VSSHRHRLAPKIALTVGRLLIMDVSRLAIAVLTVVPILEEGTSKLPPPSPKECPYLSASLVLLIHDVLTHDLAVLIHP